MIKMLKEKEKILKVAREKQLLVFKNISVSLIADFSEITEVRRQWDNLFRVLKGKKLSAAKLLSET